MNTVHAVIIALAIIISATVVVAVPSNPVPASVAPVTVQVPSSTFQISVGGHNVAFVLNTHTGAVTLCTGPAGTSPASCSGIGKAQ